jgi:ring-1,2-phenylacetyl-CoA epoxidase subunit PaaB
MNDQWPLYEVFKQDRPSGPFRNVGSVHAPDAELALMNARDVFARRPSCVALWVVPDGTIVRRSADELAREKGRRGEGEKENSIQYAVFSKQSQRQAMTYVDYVGEVAARSPVEALHRAAETFHQSPGIVWWVCPASAIVPSDPDDLPGLEAATGKLFRMPNQYHTVFTMQKIRRGEEGDE